MSQAPMARRVEDTGIEITNPRELMSTGAQKVQTQYVTAMQVQIPRTLPSVERRSLEEAAMLGADGYYAWGNGKDRVEGPTVEMAMCLARCWGNCTLDMGEVQETRDAWIFTAMFIDLETGFTYARQFRQSKNWTVYGKFDEARKEDIRFQIGQSKATRNVILRALPGWLVNRAMDRAKGGVREEIEKRIAQAKGIGPVIDAAIDACIKLGASEERVLHSLGRKARGGLTVEDLVIIAGNIAVLKAGADDVESVFPVKAAAQPLPPGTNQSDALANAIEGGANGGTEGGSVGADLQKSIEAEEAAKKSGEQASLLPDDNKPNVGTVDRTRRK